MRKSKDELLRELESIDKECKEMSLKIKIAQKKNKIKGMQEVSDDNVSYVKFIESLKLQVESDGKIIPVNHETLCYYDDNQLLIKTRIFILQQQVNDYQQQLEELEK